MCSIFYIAHLGVRYKIYPLSFSFDLRCQSGICMSHNTGKSALPDIYALTLGHCAYIRIRPRHRAHIRTHPWASCIHIRRVCIYRATHPLLRCSPTHAHPRPGTVHAHAPGHRACTRTRAPCTHTHPPPGIARTHRASAHISGNAPPPTL